VLIIEMQGTRVALAFALLVVVVISTTSGAAPPPPPPPLTPFALTIDASKPGAAFDFLYGVDHGPLCDSGVDVSAELRDMGATLIRTHDSGVLDWPVV
jgi:hypothetical protein